MTVLPSASPGDLARHVLFVTTPALWPGWPFLPVVRRDRGAEDLGVLFDARGCAAGPGSRRRCSGPICSTCRRPSTGCSLSPGGVRLRGGLGPRGLAGGLTGSPRRAQP
ncbi:hypothetical protein [Fimbriiglobus ruber]|uniref:hypothetical protein n=1 Tax=Fimbriiglobus ruber TaxID=1908690 RepID=UPI00117AD7F4|nr:hypothetical protein [Fimbriiglobus ruber]